MVRQFNSTLIKQPDSNRFQPPKKRGAAPPTAAPGKNKPRSRQSKLAKENDISGEEETEIKEVFHLFSTTDVEAFQDEKEGVIPREDVRKALVYTSLPFTALALAGDTQHRTSI